MTGRSLTESAAMSETGGTASRAGEGPRDDGGDLEASLCWAAKQKVSPVCSRDGRKRAKLTREHEGFASRAIPAVPPHAVRRQRWSRRGVPPFPIRSAVRLARLVGREVVIEAAEVQRLVASWRSDRFFALAVEPDFMLGRLTSKSVALLRPNAGRSGRVRRRELVEEAR